MADRDPNYTHAREMFARETKNHVMTVLHDDGLYRHLRFAAPGTGMWSWNIVTWPGHLATSGDVADGYQFARLPDMFEFFRSARGDINPSYWAEKMPHVITAKSHSEEMFKDAVGEYVADWMTELSPDEQKRLKSELDDDVFELAYSETGAYEALRDFRFESAGFTYEFEDYYEIDALEYDFHLIIAMLAIAYSVAEYDKATTLPTPDQEHK